MSDHVRMVSAKELEIANDRIRELTTALERLLPYARWQIREGGSHHPTLPSAIASAESALKSTK